MTPSAKKCVLVIEDELDMRIFLRTLLETSGYHPVLTSNGRDGLDQALAARPDLIILDVMMPQKGGALVYVQLKTDEQLKSIPVVMLSAVSPNTFFHYLNIHNAQAAVPVPQPEAYIEKPPDPQILIRTLQKYL